MSTFSGDLMHNGSCLCGAVRFEIAGRLSPPDACHCTMCRKQSGHYWASADVTQRDLTIHDAGTLSWYQSSDRVRRGFCSKCGSSLFWDPLHTDTIAVAMGALDTPSQVTLDKHIFVSEQGDYYTLTDGLPQNLR